MHGAKGSVKNRVYQFWLIRIWREKREKRKQKALLKKKRLEEERKKVIEEVVGKRDTRTWKLSKAPTTLNKKEGTVVTLLPFGKKPDKVIEVIEEKHKVGIGENAELEKKLSDIDAKATVVVVAVTKEVKKDVNDPEKLEEKKSQLEKDLKQIEKLQLEYQELTKKDSKILNVTLVKDMKAKKTVKDSVTTLEKTEIICKQELARVEEALKSASKVEEKKPVVKEQPELKVVPKDVKPTRKVETLPTKKEKVKNTLKTGAVVATVAGGTLVAFPALLQRSLQNEKSNKSSNKESNQSLKEVQKNNEAMDFKTVGIGNQSEKKSSTKTEDKKSIEEKNPKLKLYRSKLETSKEAEILIKAELERQKNYLRHLNEKLQQVDISKRVEYRFRGIHRLLQHVLTFALGVFTIPFSRHRIFGTALGLTLIGNSIRGMRNSLRMTEEHHIYIEWKDVTKAIYSEQLALKQLKKMTVDSLTQIKGLKEDVEREFYGKVPFQEYDEMKTKLEAMELKLIEKQKQIEEAEEQLRVVEEKNKVKVKRMEEIEHH